MTSRKIGLDARPAQAALLALLLAGAPGVSRAQSAIAPLPPAAEEALNKGITAAKIPDYLVAIQFFETARKAAPTAPLPLLNLGLAVESKIAGRELRAMAWYGAYLATYPGATDAALVKTEIAKLDAKNLGDISRLLVTLRGIAVTVVNTSDYDDQSRSVEAVASLQVATGDIAGAFKTTDLIRHADFKYAALSEIAEAQFAAGDVAGAKKTMAAALKSALLIHTESTSRGIASGGYAERDRLIQISGTLADMGDFAGAEKTANLLLRDIPKQVRAQVPLAVALIKSGNAAGGQKMFAAAVRTAETFVMNADYSAGAKDEAFELIAQAQARNGLPAEAQKTAGQIEDAYYKAFALSGVGLGVANGGNLEGAHDIWEVALAIAERIADPSQKFTVQHDIAVGQSANGDSAGAQISLQAALKTAALLPNDTFSYSSRAMALATIAATQAKAGDVAGAKATVAAIDKTEGKMMAQAGIAAVQLEANDIAGARESLAAARTANALLKPTGDYTTKEPRLTLAQGLIKIGDLDGARQVIEMVGWQEYGVDEVGAILAKAAAAVEGPHAEWIRMLEDANEGHPTPLGGKQFTAFAATLNALPQAVSASDGFSQLQRIAERNVAARKAVSGMLKEQLKN